MALIRWRPRREWDPFSWVSAFRDEMDRFFEKSLSPWRPAGAGLFDRAWSPAIDVYEDKDDVVVRADLPGMKKEEIDISITDDVLTLKGEKKKESEITDENYHRLERYYGSFQRSVALPSYVDTDKVKATYKDGVLEVALPKKEGAKAKKILIEGA